MKNILIASLLTCFSLFATAASMTTGSTYSSYNGQSTIGGQSMSIEHGTEYSGAHQDANNFATSTTMYQNRGLTQYTGSTDSYGNASGGYMSAGGATSGYVTGHDTKNTDINGLTRNWGRSVTFEQSLKTWEQDGIDHVVSDGSTTWERSFDWERFERDSYNKNTYTTVYAE